MDGTGAAVTTDYAVNHNRHTTAPLPALALAHPPDATTIRAAWVAGTPLAALIADLVALEAIGENWVQYRCADAPAVNPQIVARATERGMPIVALSELPRSLEDVYLSIVADEKVERGVWSDGGDKRLEMRD